MALDLCKYYKKQEYVSYNDGLTWQPLDNYERGELYESHSSSCGAGIFQYQWVQINNGYICDGKNRYTREIYQYSEDGQVWYNVWPTQYRKGTLVESNSPFCDNAGNGQYSSGDTEPISGDTEDCPPNYVWNGWACECQGHIIGGECITCPPHSSWDGSQCVCDKWWKMINGVCVYVDPLKTIKCEDSDGILSNSDVNYYENGWAVLSYTIGDCIYRINAGAFNGQIYMHDVSIPSTVSEVGDLAFANCKNLESLTFPSSLEVLGIGAFTQCAKLKQVNFNGAIPSTLNNSLFSNCESLESATWLQYNNITSIGIRCFFNCYSLQNVVFPQTLSSIDIAAFRNCRSITSIEIPSGVSSIQVDAFSDCTSLSSVRINSDTISLGDAVFSGCTSLTSVTVNSSGVTMGDNVFNGCENLVKITFTSPTPFSINSGFFDNTNECLLIVPCESLQAYKTAWSEYEDRITCTDTGVYYRWVDVTTSTYCDGTDEYTKQKEQSTTNGITWTDTGVYRPVDFITHYSTNCGYVGDVALTITNEDGYTRYYEPCPTLTKFIAYYNQYSANPIYSAECDSNTALTTATTRPSGYQTYNMLSAEVGDCITSIGDEAFNQCYNITAITVGSGVTAIGNFAFGGCEQLQGITINATVPPSLGFLPFDNTNDCAIYVPSGSVNAYKSAWTDVSSRIQAIT